MEVGEDVTDRKKATQNDQESDQGNRSIVIGGSDQK